MSDSFKQLAKITVIIRSVNTISVPADEMIRLLSLRVDQILLLFSGSKDEYVSVVKKYEPLTTVNIIWTYSFGYLEPIISGVSCQIRNSWLMMLTDRDVLSDFLLESLFDLTQHDVAGFFIERIVTVNIRDIYAPSWLKKFIKPGFKHNFMLMLYKKEKVVISEIIHKPRKIFGKVEYLDPSKYYISRNYMAGDMENDKTFLYHWIEKEKRYIFLEMFETRISRAAAIRKVLEFTSFFSNFKFKSNLGNFLLSELSKSEYYIFEFIRNLAIGYIGLNAYQKVKLGTIKETRNINAIGFATSEFLRSDTIQIMNFLKMESTIVNSEMKNFQDMAVVKDSEIAFIKHFLNKYREIDNRCDKIDIDEVIYFVKSSLENYVRKYMPSR